MSDTEARVCKIVVNWAGSATGPVTSASRLSEDIRADSLDVIEIVMAIEDEFAIQIPDADLEGIVTVADLIALAAPNSAAPV